MFVAQHFQTGHQSQLSCQPVNLCEMWTMMVSTVYTVHCSNVVLPDFGTSRVRTLDIHIFIIDHRIRVKSRHNFVKLVNWTSELLCHPVSRILWRWDQNILWCLHGNVEINIFNFIFLFLLHSIPSLYLLRPPWSVVKIRYVPFWIKTNGQNNAQSQGLMVELKCIRSEHSVTVKHSANTLL